MAQTYRDLVVWQQAKALAIQVYRATERFPRDELFGLTSQTRRAAVSITSNIAEGQGRGSKQEFARFLLISRGSLLELETQIDIAIELGYGSNEELEGVQKSSYKVLGLLNRLLAAMGNKARPEP